MASPAMPAPKRPKVSTPSALSAAGRATATAPSRLPPLPPAAAANVAVAVAKLPPPGTTTTTHRSAERVLVALRRVTRTAPPASSSATTAAAVAGAAAAQKKQDVTRESATASPSTVQEPLLVAEPEVTEAKPKVAEGLQVTPEARAAHAKAERAKAKTAARAMPVRKWRQTPVSMPTLSGALDVPLWVPGE